MLFSDSKVKMPRHSRSRSRERYDKGPDFSKLKFYLVYFYYYFSEPSFPTAIEETGIVTVGTDLVLEIENAKNGVEEEALPRGKLSHLHLIFDRNYSD